MNWDNFKVIADKIRPLANYVFLHCWGEPLLHKRIIDMINYLKPIRTHISTNGQLVTDNMAQRLAASGVDIGVSIDGYTQKVYEKYRRGGSVEKAYNAIKLLKKHGVKQLSSRFVVFKHNIHELQLYLKEMRRIGINNAEGKVPYIVPGSGLEHADGWKRPKRKISKSCIDLESVMTIYVNGDVVPCCYIYNSSVVFGNLLKDEVIDVYNNGKISKFRIDLNTGVSEVCQRSCLSIRR
jgi:MoaA/NifB/PqqE/SkfB family radical SAM enzyme